MARLVTVTQKVSAEGTTLKGSLYAHVDFDPANGLAVAVRFSSPGRFADTTIERVLDNLGEAVTAIIAEASGA